jgi:MFS family permease
MRKGERGMKRLSVWQWACVLAVFMDFGGGLVGLATPLLAVQWKANPTLLGVIGAAGPLGYTVGCLLFQPVTDAWGRKRSMLVGSVGVLLLCGALAAVSVTGWVTALGVLNLLNGLCLAFFWPPTQASAGVGVDPSQLLHTLLAYNLSWSSGRAIGTAIAGTLFERHPALPFLLAAISSLVVVAMSFWLPAEGDAKSLPKEIPDDPSLPDELVLGAQLGNLVRSFAFFEAIVLFAELGKRWGWAPEEVSRVLTFLNAGQWLAFLVAPKLLRRVGWRWVVGAQGSVAFCAFLLGLLRDRTALSIVLFGLGFAAGITTVVSLYLSILSQGRSVKGSARHEAGVGAGAVFGPLLGGWVLQHFTPFTAFLLPSLLAGVTISSALWQRAQLTRSPMR